MDVARMTAAKRSLLQEVLQLLAVLYVLADDDVRAIMRVACQTLAPLIDAKFPGLLESLMHRQNRCIGARVNQPLMKQSKK